MEAAGLQIRESKSCKKTEKTKQKTRSLSISGFLVLVLTEAWRSALALSYSEPGSPTIKLITLGLFAIKQDANGHRRHRRGLPVMCRV